MEQRHPILLSKYEAEVAVKEKIIKTTEVFYFINWVVDYFWWNDNGKHAALGVSN